MENFIENLEKIPNEIIDEHDNRYELSISKNGDGEWVVLYENDWGYLKDKNDRHNQCLHSDIKLSIAVKNTLDWLMELGYIKI